jgi:hypothetical protein
MPAPLVGAAAVAAARLLAAQLAKQGTKKAVRKVVDRQAARIAAEKLARKQNPVTRNPKDDLRKDLGGSGGGNVYRAPARPNRPRLRDTDDMPRKTTVRQQIGPKTKSGKFSEKKYPTKTNTQPPAKKPVTEKPKVETPDVVKVRGRVVAINKPSNNPRIRKRQEAQLRISRREFLAERKRQEKLEIKRKVKDDTKTKTDFGIYSKSGKKYTVNVPKSSKGSGSKEVRPEQTTIESRLQSRSESLPLSARNQAGTDRMPTAEWRRYAQILRDSTAKSRNVTPEQIARGRARATMPTAERRAAEIQAARNRFVAKAKARGMTDAQIKQAIARARAEAASIARKAAK